MKIYAVTKGTYSDYHICALTVSEEKAKILALIYSDRQDSADIEEYEDGEGEEMRIFWHCDENGNNATLYEFPGKEEVLVCKEISGGNRIYGVAVYAKDDEHAEKKAHDMLAEYKAKQAGIR